MDASMVYQHLSRLGFSLRADDSRLTVEPASRLDDETRALIRAHKAGLLEFARNPFADIPTADDERRYDAQVLRGEAVAADYSEDDVGELHRLARRWHELAWPCPKASEDTFAVLRRISPANVIHELRQFREMVGRLEGAR